jgi:hypothetical protein
MGRKSLTLVAATVLALTGLRVSGAEKKPKASSFVPSWGVSKTAGQVSDADAQRHMSAYLSWPGVWNFGAVALARVGETKSRDGKPVPSFLSLEMEVYFTIPAGPPKLVLQRGSLQQVAGPYTWAMPAKRGDLLLVRVELRSRTGFRSGAVVYGIKVPDKDRDQWIASLKRVQEYRRASAEADAGDKAKSKASDKAGAAMLASGDEMAILYLVREFVITDKQAPEAWKPSLLRVRNNRDYAVTTRLQASEILHRSFADYREGKQHIQWIRDWFPEPSDMKPQDRSELLTQLRKYAEPGDVVKTDIPAMIAILGSPKAGDREVGFLAGWVDGVMMDREAAGSLLVSLIEAAFAQNGRDKRLAVMGAAQGAVWRLSVRVRQKLKTAPKSVQDDVRVLKECRIALQARSRKTRNWDEKSAVDAMLKNIDQAIGDLD